MSRSTSPASSPRRRREFVGSDIVAHAFGALGNSAIRDIHVLGRRGPHQIAMTPKELGELGHLEDAVPRVDLADFPPVLDDALLEPGQRKSVTHLREFADLAGGQGQDDRLRFLRQAGRGSRATARSSG